MTIETDTDRKQLAVVYNPTKVTIEELRETVDAAASAAGWAPIMWFETTEEDTGHGVASQAVDKGADVVLVAGGDGTVRAVAGALGGTDVALALLPSGTGNLLARNLDFVIGNTDELISAAFSGTERRIDLGIAEITRVGGEKESHAFLVMAGLGIDAKMIANTRSSLKKAVGWLAYIDGTIRSIPEVKPIRLHYKLDRLPERTSNVHTIIVGNCGSLPGGILLMPEAKPDDGILDIVAFRPRGPFGWVRVWNKLFWENGVLRKSAVGRKVIDLSRDVKDVTYWRGKKLWLRVDGPQQFQLDGDEFGEAIAVHTWIDPGALIVLMPPPTE